ncbi:hypothetical protein QFZ23_002286 [Arthrobacter globiformis]|uniref:hypothetical protein n=1 Tax=Arthrobacter globiformis TaxID=1665 RepID=UPI002785B9CF|nr:hypothetical protein [Arthrobacter globiformis]MDQ1058385.1 hypothetical protein [Arthrobacter globiformis]
MPVTRNVAWDGRLEAFKGRDTGEFVALVAAVASACAECGLPVRPEEQLSLIVDITEGADGGGIEFLAFDTCICHRRCREPDLTLRTAAGAPDELKTIGARLILGHPDRSGIRAVPVLAYTLAPVLTFREPGGELTSVLVSVLISHGFRLTMSSDYAEMLRHARDVHTSVSCTATEEGRVSLHINGERIHSQQLDPAAAGDAAWLEAAGREGKILVISGDYLKITSTGVNIDAAARLGTLVTGNVSTAT